MAFSVTDPTPHLVRQIAPGLQLNIDRSDPQAEPAGWDVSVVARPGGENLLYHSRFWHGPYPSQVDAWAVAESYFPAERQLRVRGRPWTVTIRCEACATRGQGASVVFTGGVLRVAWRPMR